MKTTIQVTGMHCPSCKALLEDVASEVKGVLSSDIDPKTGLGTIEHDEKFNFDDFQKAVAELKDYRVERITTV